MSWPHRGQDCPCRMRGGCIGHIPGGQQDILGSCGHGSVSVCGVGTRGGGALGAQTVLISRRQAWGSAVGAVA